MEQILDFIQTNGLPVFVIATCIIAIIGILKLCKVFNKVTNKNVKKCIYYILDVALAFGGSAIYYAIFKLSFNSYIAFSLAQITATTTLYAMYENFGVRNLVQLFFNLIAKKLKPDQLQQFKKLAKKLGFDLATQTLQQVKEEETIKVPVEEVKN